MSQPLCRRSSLLPASAQSSNIVFGTALATALPRHTQRKVPLLLTQYRPIRCSLANISLAQNCGRLRRLQRGRVTQQLLLPVKSQEVCQGVRGDNTPRRGVFSELPARLPGVLVFLQSNITQGTPLNGIWKQKNGI